jgi:hypothetical protein
MCFYLLHTNTDQTLILALNCGVNIPQKWGVISWKLAYFDNHSNNNGLNCLIIRGATMGGTAGVSVFVTSPSLN